jgi:dolichol-phosphate mannosyltransferase
VICRCTITQGLLWQSKLSAKDLIGLLAHQIGYQLMKAPELSVVIPTFNEAKNVPILVNRLSNALEGFSWEAIFVDDDSPDGTADVAKSIGANDVRIRTIKRIGRRGLSGACLEGALSSQAKYIAVMDADLQHDEKLLCTMLEEFNRNEIDLVCASRYMKGGSASSFSGVRARISSMATKFSQKLLGVNISDPMSGFFMIKRTSLEKLAPSIFPQGFKILLDIVSTSKGSLKVAEVPLTFGERIHGSSKLDMRSTIDFFGLILLKLTGGLISPRFIQYGLVGFTGLILHLTILRTLISFDLQFDYSQTFTTLLVISWNFYLNNAFTYRDKKLTGMAYWKGMLKFQLICGVGVISNVGVASITYASGEVWWVAGLAGACMGAIWNYIISAMFVWKQR